MEDLHLPRIKFIWKVFHLNYFLIKISWAWGRVILIFKLDNLVQNNLFAAFFMQMKAEFCILQHTKRFQQSFQNGIVKGFDIFQGKIQVTSLSTYLILLQAKEH